MSIRTRQKYIKRYRRRTRRLKGGALTSYNIQIIKDTLDKNPNMSDDTIRRILAQNNFNFQKEDGSRLVNDVARHLPAGSVTRANLMTIISIVIKEGAQLPAHMVQRSPLPPQMVKMSDMFAIQDELTQYQRRLKECKEKEKKEKEKKEKEEIADAEFYDPKNYWRMGTMSGPQYYHRGGVPLIARRGGKSRKKSKKNKKKNYIHNHKKIKKSK